MDYRLELLDEKTFENMINTICQKLLGMGVISFATGKDGGRDGKFTGTAQNFQDSISPWSGKFIIQAKHTEIPTASCSDYDFGNKIIPKEILKIKNLKEQGDVDCYLLFTNRKYSGVKGEEIIKMIIEETNVQNSVIIGKETINDLYLNSNKEIVQQYNLNKHHIPFDFSDAEIKDIIFAFKSQLPKIVIDLKEQIEKSKFDFDHLEKEIKNEKNKLGKEYYQNVILTGSLMDFEKLERFLENPINSVLKDYYFDIASELNALITIKRSDFGPFEEIFAFLYKSVCDGSTQLLGSKRHVSTFLHYLYFECLIGEK